MYKIKDAHRPTRGLNTLLYLIHIIFVMIDDQCLGLLRL